MKMLNLGRFRCNACGCGASEAMKHCPACDDGEIVAVDDETTAEDNPDCNWCGFTCTMNPDHANLRGSYGMINVTADGGYGSDVLLDATRHRFSLCEYCLDHLFSQFTKPPGLEDYMSGTLLKQPWMSLVDRLNNEGDHGISAERMAEIVADINRRAAARAERALATMETACDTCDSWLENAPAFVRRIAINSLWDVGSTRYTVWSRTNEGILLRNVNNPADERRIGARWLLKNGKRVQA